MGIKHQLKQIRLIDLEVKTKMEELDRLNNSFLKSPSLKEINVQESKVSLKDDAYVKIINLNDYINDKVDKLIDLKYKLIQAVEQLDNSRERTIIWMKYISSKSWDEIAEELKISKTTLFMLHDEAVKKIEKCTKKDDSVPNNTKDSLI
ncbi:DUF1492 domain-containing protein [uncultured Granulicatella sp.]|jgi:DNA-directed RNA polymerase specialized sigma subunit|uniref:DUF1492 domain-containing protein n=1 Tax=uncultured Granulicatella sp. TaxID=316089 RepID=UPI0026278278|nr:DUF1492 domain-containing protein [uncultured Granulicatella sp.]